MTKKKATTSDMPRETHVGELVIGDVKIPCSVLSDGTRIFSTRGITRAFGSESRNIRNTEESGGTELPPFLSTDAIKPFLPAELTMVPNLTIRYTSKSGGLPRVGIPAEALPHMCFAITDAHDAGSLRSTQFHLYENARRILRSLACVGVIALVDEATGFQADRERNELQQMLAAYLSEEARPWVKTFPDEFFIEVSRLRGWTYDPKEKRGPRAMAQVINTIIYDGIPQPVMSEIRRREPTDGHGNRDGTLHQHLSTEVGLRQLQSRIVGVLYLMGSADSWGEFMKLFDRKMKGQTYMSFPVA